MTLVMGIDGGGSTIRVAITDHNLTVLGESSGGTVNPGSIGHDAAKERIREAVRAALNNAGLTSDQIEAVGIGIAGASAQHSEAWLREVISPILPNALLVPSSDFEIALVGARGERRGILILAGTGSIAYGVNDAGESAQVGGWGYLLGDEGSGCWIGLQALRHIASADDGMAGETQLTPLILNLLGLSTPRDLIGWLYRSDKPRIPEIAALAPLVLKAADNGDSLAYGLIYGTAARLAALGQRVARKLDITTPNYAFAGGLLETENTLSARLCLLLHLPEFPQRLHPPVIGAALLAINHLKSV